MIISHKYKFIFIKVRKTASTSIQHYLSQWCGSGDVFTGIEPIVGDALPYNKRNKKKIWNPFPEIMENNISEAIPTLKDLLKLKKYYSHIGGRVLKHRVSKKIWNSYYKFCVERNPWDKSLSHYYMRKIKHHDDSYTFDAYLEFNACPPCSDFFLYTDTKGNLLVDKVVLYESLIDDLSVVFDTLGIPFNGSLNVHAKSEYRADRRPYQEVYTHTQRRIIENEFSKEMKMFNYSW